MALALSVELSAKVKSPCAKGENVNQCAPCAALSEEQWAHLRGNFVKRSTNRSCMKSQGDYFEGQDTECHIYRHCANA